MRITLFIAIVICCFSCAEPEASEYSRFGVSFTCPAGWSITEEQMLENDVYYITCEKSGVLADAMFILNWTDGMVHREEWVAMYLESLKEELESVSADVYHGEISESVFAGYESMSVVLESELLGARILTELHSFHAGSRSYVLLKQGTKEDQSSDLKDFRTIESSFTVLEHDADTIN